MGMVNGEPCIMIIIFREPGANIIETVDRIRDAIPNLSASIPEAIDVNVVMDRTPTIRASLADVEFTLIISIALVILVVFVFLRNFRATAISAISVPVSLVGTFVVMYLAGFSLNNLSLMALTIATGFVVDDTIVVLENIMRHIEAGMKPFDAAMQGAKRSGIHRHVDQYLADCRIHSDSADGRNHRTAVPRIRCHTFCNHSRIAFHFPDQPHRCCARSG